MKKRRKTTILTFHAGRIGYHRRPGLHYFSREDWNRFIAFLKAKSKLKGRRVAVLWENPPGSPTREQSTGLFPSPVLIFWKAK